MIQDVSGQQNTFAGSVEAILSQIQFPATIAAARVRAEGFFHELVVWSRAGGSGAPMESGASQKLDQLKAKYTMASEREAHAAALGATRTEPPPADSQPAIELFEDLDSTTPSLPSGADVLPHANSPAVSPQVELFENEVLPAASSANADQPNPGAGLGDNVELF
jgi:hypothetical protein